MQIERILDVSRDVITSNSQIRKATAHTASIGNTKTSLKKLGGDLSVAFIR
jgi:hypothetical protein